MRRQPAACSSLSRSLRRRDGSDHGPLALELWPALEASWARPACPWAAGASGSGCASGHGIRTTRTPGRSAGRALGRQAARSPSAGAIGRHGTLRHRRRDVSSDTSTNCRSRLLSASVHATAAGAKALQVSDGAVSTFLRAGSAPPLSHPVAPDRAPRPPGHPLPIAPSPAGMGPGGVSAASRLLPMLAFSPL